MFVFRLPYVVAAMAFSTPAFAEQQPTSGPSAQSKELRIISVDCHRQSLQRVLDENLDAPQLQLNVSGQCGHISIQRNYLGIIGTPTAVFDTIVVNGGSGITISNVTLVGSIHAFGLDIKGGSSVRIKSAKILFEHRDSPGYVAVRDGSRLSIADSYMASRIIADSRSTMVIADAVVATRADISVDRQSYLLVLRSRILACQPNSACSSVRLNKRSSMETYESVFRGSIALREQSFASFDRGKIRGKLLVHDASDAYLRGFVSYRGEYIVAGRRSFIKVVSGDNVIGSARCQRGGRITGQTAGLVLTDCPLP